MSSEQARGYTFESFPVGFRGTFTKEVTAEDNELFKVISGDDNPIHFDDEVARRHGFNARISNGFVTESRIAAALVQAFTSRSTTVLALRKDTSFLKPVYMGDVITAEIEVAGTVAAMRVLKLKGHCRNQRGEIVSETRMLVRILESSERTG